LNSATRAESSSRPSMRKVGSSLASALFH
jgi:hypothetical protein